jgi:hypothetical protein
MPYVGGMLGFINETPGLELPNVIDAGLGIRNWREKCKKCPE